MTVRVPLDYYRVLMLSARADEHQIEQAYRERIDLKPGERSWLLEFSPQAVEARAQMIQEAASVLLNPEARRNYDEHLMPADPTLTVEETRLPGVLCLYCEAGEYQAALDLAQHMLEQGHPARSDAILARAIARLTLGREAWQQGSYEEAARSLQAGLAELEECQAFPQMQAEIRIDLGKLRPYRILQLLSHEAHAPAPAGRETLVLRTADANGERQQGLALLKAMLDERGGIEGMGQDGSGLSTEDFLRFIQRVRRHLTLKEQQELFEREAERPSMVAAYLAVQVLLAAGYLENRPALVRRARGYLARLAQRQDVHLEQAICSLLLGQTEDALAHLRSTQEVEALQFIEEHSAGSPDHLPGLCRFTEKWFQEEVFPEFRGLEATHPPGAPSRSMRSQTGTCPSPARTSTTRSRAWRGAVPTMAPVRLGCWRMLRPSLETTRTCCTPCHSARGPVSSGGGVSSVWPGLSFAEASRSDMSTGGCSICTWGCSSGGAGGGVKRPRNICQMTNRERMPTPTTPATRVSGAKPTAGRAGRLRDPKRLRR